MMSYETVHFLQKLLLEFQISNVLQHSHSGWCSQGTPPTQGAAPIAAPLNNQMMTLRFFKPAALWVGVLLWEQHSEWGCYYKRCTTGSSTSNIFFLFCPKILQYPVETEKCQIKNDRPIKVEMNIDQHVPRPISMD